MSIGIPHGASDHVLDAFITALRTYESDHPGSLIELYRQNSACIRVRIIDPSFEGMPKAERHNRVWGYLKSLDHDTQFELSSLTLITPEERPRSAGSLVFDDPILSDL